MVALPVAKRFNFLVHSIADYRRQSYPHRELVIVLDQGEPACVDAIERHVTELGDPSIRVIQPTGKRTLGALRNQSIQFSTGAILCQWDDDDLYHPGRLTLQFQALEHANSDAVFLQDVALFFPAQRDLYCTNWRATPAGCFPATLMCRRSTPILYPEDGPEAERGEDTAVAQQLLARCSVHLMAGSPHLHVYVAHGNNTWPESFHRMLRDTLAMSRALLLRREAALRQGLAEIDFGSDAVAVQGNNGAAFVLGTGSVDGVRQPVP
jgi:glycosyltransferase involved in cell wall biosynthesis